MPFLLLAAWAAGHGWPALEAWLLGHPRWGGPIRAWRERGTVSRRAKWAATGMMAASAPPMGLSGAPLLATLAVSLVMIAVAGWLWRRPEGKTVRCEGHGLAPIVCVQAYRRAAPSL